MTLPTLARLAAIVRGGLCHRCGTCAGICPTGVIEPGADYFPVWEPRTGACTDCGLCVRVCPGAEFSFPEHSRRLFGTEADPGLLLGRFREAFLGYTPDAAVRAPSSSGGVGTALPLHLLRTGRIAAALVVRTDPGRPWRPQAILARTPEEVLAGTNSKYPACSTNHLLAGLRNAPGPILFTGLPCQVHGLRKMMQLQPSLERRIALVVGLVCHSCLDHRAVTDLLAHHGLPEDEVAEVVYRSGKLPGHVRLRCRDGRWLDLPYPRRGLSGYRPNAKEFLTFFFKFYSPLRCRLCPDAGAEFADLTLSDPWIKGWQGVARLREGYSLLLARTERGQQAVYEAREAGALLLEPFPPERALESQGPMARGKRRRAFYLIAKRARRGLPVPEFGLQVRLRGRERLRAARNAATYFAADRPRLRRAAVRLMLSEPGRLLVAALFFRRQVIERLYQQVRTRLAGTSAADPGR